ncbi:MAG: cobalamin biosynthesis protein [Alphaproteobacteria bacterium]|nr:cobalamin biosynthesis protein [Alphaproteobacteria bacterium SS10]
MGNLPEQIIALNALSASLAIGALAILIELIFGQAAGLRGLRWQVALHGFCRGLERRLNRQKRSDSARLIRGLLLTLTLLLPALFVGAILTFFIGNMPPPIAALLVSLILAGGLRFGAAWSVAGALRQAVAAADRQQANRLIRAHGRLDPAAMDDHAVVREAVELAARGWDRGLIAPLFWFLLFGLPGLFAVIVVQAADDVVGRGDQRTEAFGMVISRLDTILHLIPARVAGVFLIGGVALAKPGRVGAALKALVAAAKAGVMLNGRWALAPFAGGLDMALAGPGKAMKERAWIGDGTARLEPEAIGRAKLLIVFAGLLLTAAMAAAFIGAVTVGL